MALTPQQLTALRAACFANPTATAFFAEPGNAAGLQAHLNAAASPAFYVWRDRVTQDEIMQNGFDWTRVDNLSVGKARIWEWLFDSAQSNINPSKANVRAGIEQVWQGTQADLAVRAAVYTHCRRLVSVAERAFAAGVGTEANPGDAAWVGSVSSVEAATLIYKDDGTIWTAQG